MKFFEDFYRHELINQGHDVPEDTARLIYEKIHADYEDTIETIERENEDIINDRDEEISELSQQVYKLEKENEKLKDQIKNFLED